jgi:hypothetical protein
MTGWRESAEKANHVHVDWVPVRIDRESRRVVGSRGGRIWAEESHLERDRLFPAPTAQPSDIQDGS